MVHIEQRALWRAHELVVQLSHGAFRGEEAIELQPAAGSVPIFGVYTYGEFARTTSVAGYHNSTVTAVAL